MKLKKNLVLIGMMGVGKSLIGNLLSKKLNLKFFDIDELIEKKNNMKINEIFSKKGEVYFRKEEEKITLEYIKIQNCIIASGGGAFINPKIREKILEKSISIWLHVDLNTITRRLKFSKKRPIINKYGLDKIKKIFWEREKTYLLAKHKIDCQNLTKKEILDKIIKII